MNKEDGVTQALSKQGNVTEREWSAWSFYVSINVHVLAADSCMSKT